MTTSGKPTKPGKAEKWTARSERLAAALRENLKRRKAQARGREAGPAPGAAAPDAPAADVPAADDPPSPDFRRNPGTE